MDVVNNIQLRDPSTATVPGDVIKTISIHESNTEVNLLDAIADENISVVKRHMENGLNPDNIAKSISFAKNSDSYENIYYKLYKYGVKNMS